MIKPSAFDVQKKRIQDVVSWLEWAIAVPETKHVRISMEEIAFKLKTSISDIDLLKIIYSNK